MMSAESGGSRMGDKLVVGWSEGERVVGYGYLRGLAGLFRVALVRVV